MYSKVECIVLECDNCKEIYQNESSGYSIWVLGSDAWDKAQDDGWHKEGEKHYCGECHDFNDNDELIIKTERKKQS